MISISRKLFFAVCGVFVSLALLCGVIWMALPDGLLRIWFLNVGQGDAVLMQVPDGGWVLTDGGPGSAVVQELSRIIPFYDREIELVILSHPHADHLDGLLHVFQRYHVQNLLLTGVKYDYVGYERLLQLAKDNGVRLLYPKSGVDFRIGKVGIDMIYPSESLVGRSFSNVNNSSIVYRLIYGDFVAIFSGDLEDTVEDELVKQVGLNLDAELMKAGHHGSKTSNTQAFVERISPDFAVISCGVDNKFKHPFAGTLETFHDMGIRLSRTDVDGPVGFVVSGEAPRLFFGNESV